MKLLITAINAKYVHTNLAVRYLNKKVENFVDSEICEYSINDSILGIERSMILKAPDAVAFSCYLWNIDMVLRLCSDLKKSNPDIVLILGGPEAGHNSIELIENNNIDYIIKSEGEIVFPELIKFLIGECTLPEYSLTYMSNNGIVDYPDGRLPEFSDDIPFPYSDSDFLGESKNKIIYYESSRGCPYSCKYCLSGEGGKVRFKAVDDVKKDLLYFDNNRVPLVKFVDRTFNADRKRACDIWSHINDLEGDTRFHMEITGELIDDATLELLKTVRADKLQFEIGVQSTNPETLKSINRKCNIDKLFHNIKSLLSFTGIHVHLDLIVGLPYETFDIFKKSFNDVVDLRPHVLQIGFLKLLYGSAMRDEALNHGMVFRDYPPYEIISNKYISTQEVLFLKDVDYVFDKVYNSGDFKKTIGLLFDCFADRFEIFSELVYHFRQKNLIGKPISKGLLFDEVYECFRDIKGIEEYMRYDYITALHPGRMPYWYRGDGEFKNSDFAYSFLKNEDIKKQVMPKYYDVPAKSIIKHIRFEKFSDKIMAFDYSDNEVYDVSEFFEKINK